MKFTIVYFLLVCCTYSIHAQESYPIVYAKREFLRIDKNKDNVLESSELKNRWNALKVLDNDKNELISVEEYSKVKIPYLETQEKRKLNIRYKTTPEEDLYLDIYYPSGFSTRKSYPVLLYVHGGGWFNGSKENITKGHIKELSLELIKQGFAVVSVNYRLTRYKSIVMKDCVVDAMDALRFLSKNQQTLGVDPKRVFVFGDSAGGHLAQMITVADPSNFQGDPDLYNYKYDVVAGVSWYGPCDFTQRALFETDDPTKKPDRFRGRILRPGADDDPTLTEFSFKEMSPVYYLTTQSPPLYMMAAEDDTTIPVAHAYHMKKKADDIKANVELLVVKNAGHNWRKAGGDPDPSTDIIIQKTVSFYMKYQ